MNRSIKTICLSAGFMNLAGFAVLSFLSVYLSFSLRFSTVETGTVLSIMTLTSRGLPLLTGGLGDQYGYKKMMGLGLLIRGTGFIILGSSDTFTFIACGAACIGIGSACYEPSSLALFSNQSEGEIRKRMFTYLNLSLNGGAIIGPLLGGLLLLLEPSYPFILSGLIFYILFFVQFAMVAPSEHTVHHRRSFLDGMKHIAKNKTYMLYCFAMIFFWFMFAQLTVSIPLHMYHLTQSERFVTFALTMNAITGFFCMILFRRLFIQINTFKLLKIGIILMALSLLMVSIYSSPYWLLACIVLFTLGETFVLPASDIAISEFSQEAFQGSYFGFFEISFAIGATLGNYAGSYLTNHDSNHTTLWITFFCVGMISFIFIGLLSRNAR